MEHLIGYSGRNFKTIRFHPQDSSSFVYNIGGLVVIEDINDRNKQSFLRGHDMPITALSVSHQGTFID